jgi:hypothetical protein
LTRSTLLVDTVSSINVGDCVWAIAAINS